MKRIGMFCTGVLLALVGAAGVFFLNFREERIKERAHINMALSFCDTDDPRMRAMLQDILEKAKEEDMTVEWSSAHSSLCKQQEDIREFLKEEPEYLVVVPVKTQGLEEALDGADAEKTKLILLDRKIDNFKNIEILAQVGTDALWEGEECARLLSEFFGGKRGRLLEVEGESGSSTNKLHGTGFRNALTEYPNLEIAGVVEGRGDRETAKNSVLNYLRSGKRIDGIYASTDEEGLGALAALEELGIAGEIPIVSINGIQDVKKALLAGVYYGCVEATPYLAEELFSVIEEAESGKTKGLDRTVEGKVYLQDTAKEMRGY